MRGASSASLVHSAAQLVGTAIVVVIIVGSSRRGPIQISVYGTNAVIDALSKFEGQGATTSSPNGRGAFVTLVEQMRKDVGHAVVGREMLAALLFGPAPVK
jgi:hypothetical protein